MTWSIILGLGSGLCWGTADFLGGFQSRRYAALTVALWSQAIAGTLLLLALLLLSGGPNLAGMGWSMAAGICGGTALLLFYRGLAIGVMSIVAPISACGALIPVVIGAMQGERPGPLAWLGIVAAVAGIVLVSLQMAPTQSGGSTRTSLLLALGAALGFGLFFACIDRATAAPEASPLWVNVWARAGSLPLLAGLHLVSMRGLGWPGRSIFSLALVGVLDMTANLLFTFATQLGYLSVAAVLSSLYPVMTVALGRLVLSERLTRLQYGGVALALLGIVLLASG